MFKTMEQITQKVITELSLVPGVSLQVYKEPVIKDKIQSCFDFLFDKRFWDHLTVTTTHTLNGTTGVVLNDLTGVKSYQHIQWVKYYPYHEGCVFKSKKDGDYLQTLDYFVTPLPYNDPEFATKVFRIYPQELQLEIKVRALRSIDAFDDDDVVPFDYLCLTHFVAAETLAADGLNPGAANRQQVLFDQRYQDLITQDSNQSIVYGRMDTNYFTVKDT